MRRIVCVGFCFLLATVVTAQTPEKSLNVIEIEGYAKIPVQPSVYTAIITIQETEQKVGYTTVGKVPIDSIKLFMMEAVKKNGIDPKELKVIGTSSRDMYNGQLGFALQSITYAYNVANKDLAQNIVNQLKFAGLKGIVINWTTTEEKKAALRDSLYYLALLDAQKAAERFASKLGKKVGDVKNAIVLTPDMARLDRDLTYDLYNNFRFEYDSRDLFIKGSVRAVFELK